MEDETRTPGDIVLNASLLDAYQYIIYELREDISPALTAVQLIRKTTRDPQTTDKLLDTIEARLKGATETISVLMVEIFLNRLRHEFNDDSKL